MTQTMLYKGSEKPNAELGGRKLVFGIFDDDKIEDAVADGWSLSADEAEGLKPAAELSLLDENAATVIETLPALTPDELQALLVAEKNGKTRKGVVEAIEKALAEVGEG